MFAVDVHGNPVAKLELVEGATRLDAELFVLRGGVPGAVGVRDADPVEERLFEAFRRLGLSESGAKIAARGRQPPLPAVRVARQKPRRLRSDAPAIQAHGYSELVELKEYGRIVSWGSEW